MAVGTLGFVAERLVEAREARGLSITDLADLTGIAKQLISEYEKGKKTPSPESFSRLADKLNLPHRFFFKSPPQINREQIFFRSLSAATKKARLRAERRLNWFEEIIEYLTHFIELLPVNIPNYDIGNDPNIISLEDVEELALKCRREWGLGDGPISNVVRLLENNGIIVARQELDATTLDSFSRWSSENIPIIVLGIDKRSAVRSRLDAGHELGHLVLHRSIDKLGGTRLAIIEHQAFRFASAFLLPARSFVNDFSFPSLDVFLNLKLKWKVSIAAMIFRCKELSIIDDYQYSYLFKSYNKRGWKKREPYDDEIIVETPVFISRCIDLIINEKIQAPEDILNNLIWPNSDLEGLIGLPRGYLTRSSVATPLPQLKNQKKSTLGHGPGTIIPFSRKKD
jgi:Zn-dependent peptidase ImmA (M78 family)/DNA-binding XRE family transcriptional regulator